MTSSPSTDHERRALPPTVAFVGTGIGFASLYLAAGAPTPLLPIYEQQWRFAPSALTIAFAAYAIALVVALLTTGSLSDYLGRRPVLLGALVVEIAAMLLFLFAPSIAWITAARVVQGVATGAATSAYSASIVELAPEKLKKFGAVIGSVAPAAGLGLGALLTGIAVQFSSSASQVVFVTLTAIMTVSLVAIALSSETATRQPGAVRALIPRISIPSVAWREFAAAIPVHMAAWMLAGLFLGLVPTILEDIFRIHSGLVTGVTVFVEPGAAAVTGLLLARVSARRTVLVGASAILVGTVLIVIAFVVESLPLLWVGAVIGGVGFGASFSGAVRLVIPFAAVHQRAGLFAGIYLIAYLSFGVPAVIAGQLVGPLGLFPVVVLYGAATIAAAAVGIVTQLRLRRS
jgi:MFS family permease